MAYPCTLRDQNTKGLDGFVHTGEPVHRRSDITDVPYLNLCVPERKSKLPANLFTHTNIYTEEQTERREKQKWLLAR